MHHFAGACPAHSHRPTHPCLSLGKAGMQQSGREGGEELSETGRGGEGRRRREQTEEIKDSKRQNREDYRGRISWQRC